ncbi:MAG: EAL domain-containing protein [Gammaproteobacteria bacterium]|nr:EAL domain-containing protein [Gammaproteobacteria bacterium]
MAIATIHNPTVSNPQIDSKVLAQQTNLLFSYARPVHFAALAVFGLIAYLFKGAADPELFMAWAIYAGAVELIRLLLTFQFHSRHIVAADAKKWFRIFRFGNFLSAVSWGLVGVVFFPPADIAQQSLLAVMLLSVAALAIPLLSFDFRSYLVFSSFAVLPVGLNLIFMGEQLPVMIGLLIYAVLVLLCFLAFRFNADTLDGIRTRFAYADIAEEFDTEVTTRINAENTLRKGEQRGRKQSYVLLDLAKEESVAAGDLPRALTVITEKAAQAIQCTRVSVWFCEPDFTEFRCVHLFDNGYHDAAPNIRLGTGEHARLYKRLERMRTFAISDTQTDKRAGDFWINYISPYRVSAALGAPFRQGGKVRGVIVHEHVGYPRTFSRDERMFASSLADFIALAISASGRNQVQEQLRHMANYDRLTGLPNRAMFHDRLNHALSKARRANREIAVLFVDVDRFKSINDSMGHHTGDRVLRSIAKRLMRCVRSSDTVARLGGDEFTVILEEFEDLDTVVSVCERILETTAEPLVIADGDMQLTCSIGISLYPNDASDSETLLQNADTAMYRAKKSGRNGYSFFTPDMHTQAVTRMEKENDLRKAMQRDEFELFYQPQVDTSSGKMVGVEALVRWNHPDRGLIAPGEFIPLAEETGQIVALGEWVLRAAAAQARKWERHLSPDLHMAVNLSVGQFMLRNVPTLVSDVLDESGVKPENLLLEITESLAVGEAKSTMDLLNELKQLGCRLALDDFGTGSSSLTYLKKFPVDIIKIDRSFVTDLVNDPHDAAIARATIGLAKSLGLLVVAEGVETDVQKSWLTEEGCDVMQGFLFARPLNSSDLEEWYRERVLLLAEGSTGQEGASRSLN